MHRKMYDGGWSLQIIYMFPLIHAKRGRFPPFFIRAMSYKYINAAVTDFFKKVTYWEASEWMSRHGYAPPW